MKFAHRLTAAIIAVGLLGAIPAAASAESSAEDAPAHTKDPGIAMLHKAKADFRIAFAALRDECFRAPKAESAEPSRGRAACTEKLHALLEAFKKTHDEALAAHHKFVAERQAEREAKKAAREAEQARKEQAKLAEKAAKEKAAFEQKAARDAEKALKDKAKLEEKTAKDKVKLEQKAKEAAEMRLKIELKIADLDLEVRKKHVMLTDLEARLTEARARGAKDAEQLAEKVSAYRGKLAEMAEMRAQYAAKLKALP